MKTPLHIAVDLLSGDTSPQTFLSYLKKTVLRPTRKLRLTIFLPPDIAPPSFNESEERVKIHFVHCEECITMADEPVRAVKQKLHSSLIQGISLLKNHEIDAFITTGNTGALVAAAKLNLALFPHVSRPALMAFIPTKNQPAAIIDVGANVHCRSKQFIEFAKLGMAMQHCYGIKAPRIGLLNIGEEEYKGQTERKKAYRSLQAMSRFCGNIEGKEIFEGHTQVIVTDGFSGNVFLKTAEGISSFILEQLSASGQSDFMKKFDPQGYPGAILAGIERLIIKCHGSSRSQSILASIQKIVQMSENDIMRRFYREFTAISNS